MTSITSRGANTSKHVRVLKGGGKRKTGTGHATKNRMQTAARSEGERATLDSHWQATRARVD